MHNAAFKKLTNYSIVIFGVAIFYSILIYLISFTPDEHFYANVSFAIAKAFQGVLPISSINTEHAPLFVLLGGVFSWVFKTNSLYVLRYCSVILSFLLVFLYYKIFTIVLRNKTEGRYALTLLFLIPAFFYSSVRFYLEIPASLALALVILLLIKKKSSLLVGLALVLVLLTKEYYFFLLAPFLILVFSIDNITKRKGLVKTFGQFAVDCLFILFPSILISVLLIDFNIGPYSRMLENTWWELFGGGYNFVNKLIYSELARFIHQWSASVQDRVSGASTAVIATKAIFESPITVTQMNFGQKLWNVYKTNFSDQEISVLMLPLFVTGLLARIKFVLSEKKYEHTRNDILFFLLLGIFAFFNYHEAANDHGFRINLPVTFLFVYFSYQALLSIIEAKSNWLRYFFLPVSIVSIGLFYYLESKISFTSLLSANQTMHSLLVVKKYFYTLAYLAICIYLFIGKKFKHFSLKFIFILFFLIFILKIIPFALEKIQSNSKIPNIKTDQKFKQVVAGSFSSGGTVYSNLHCYKIYYYMDWYRVPNDDISPQFRKLSQINKNYCQSYHSIGNNAKMLSGYLLYINDPGSEVSLEQFENFVNDNRTRYRLVVQSFSAEKVNWLLYEPVTSSLL